MMDPAKIAEDFTNHYYLAFATNRPGLSGLYRDDSQLTWEGEIRKGSEEILKKLTTLPFQSVQHKVVTRDAQRVVDDTTILVSVTGLLVIDDNTNPLHFSQIFVLRWGPGFYYVANDIFRLNYG